jgi:hypothetical protein
MRVIGDIPHPQMKITIFSWNGKYTVKFEIGPFEQSYKINEGDVMGLDEVKQIVSDEFLESVMEKFLAMRNDFHLAFKKMNNT